MEAYEKAGARYIVSARKTSRLIDELKAASWTGSPKTDADAQCEFRYQPEGWRQAKKKKKKKAENLIKEAKNDAGLADHPSGRWPMNCIYFQLAMVAYNPNCWLMLFNREEEAKVEQLGHITLATARLQFLFSGSAHLAPRGNRGCQLQRSLSRAAFIRAADGAAAGCDDEGRGVCAGNRPGPPLLKGVHRILCTGGPAETITYKWRNRLSTREASKPRQGSRSPRSQVR